VQQLVQAEPDPFHDDVAALAERVQPLHEPVDVAVSLAVSAHWMPSFKARRTWRSPPAGVASPEDRSARAWSACARLRNGHGISARAKYFAPDRREFPGDVRSRKGERTRRPCASVRRQHDGFRIASGVRRLGTAAVCLEPHGQCHRGTLPMRREIPHAFPRL
jgi:hypothetical protein